MQLNAFRTQQTVAILVGSLALYVVVGWALGIESMVRVLPDSAAMPLNTALLFLVSALCLWPERDAAQLSTDNSKANFLSVGRAVGPWLLIVASGAMLVEHVLGLQLGFNWATLHRSINDGNAHPGRLAPNACIGFLLVGTALLAIARNKTNHLNRHLADGLILATVLVGVTALLSYVLGLEGLYQIAAYNRMAAPTALGLTLIGLGLWQKLQVQTLAARAMEFPDRRIVRTAVIVLSAAVVSAGLGGFAVLKQGFQESMSAALLRTTVNSAGAFQALIDQRIVLGRTIAERPRLQILLASLSANPHDPQALALVNEVGQSLLSSGISGLRLLNAQGDAVAVIGHMLDRSAEMEVAVQGNGQKATLLWRDGLVLRTSNALVRDGKPVGTLVAEQRLAEMTALLRSADAESESTDILMCGRQGDDAVCFPSRFYKVNLHIPLYKDGKPNLAISHALLGRKGVLFVKDLRGLPVFAGYSPVGESGLGMVFKTDSTDLFAPIRERLNVFVGLLGLLIGAGTLLLRAQVQPLAQRLVRAQQRTHAILESSHEAFIEMDKDGVVRDWNREAEQTFGWTREQALGRDLADLIIPLDLREAHRQGMARFMQIGEGPVLGKRIELEALHQTGASFTVEITISALMEGDEYRFTAFLHSITERKQVEADLRAAKLQAESASRAKSDFLANMSHEIRTPMNAILGMLQLMQQTSLDQRQLDYVDKTEAAAKTLLGILNDILDFSKVEAGKMTLDPHPFEIDKLLGNIGVILSASVGGKDVEVLFDVDPMLAKWIVGDALRLQQVLINLAGNALKFTAHGEVVVSVRVCPPAQEGGQRMRIAVRDSGIGIAQDQLNSIFEGFTQAETSTTRRFGGTGLGLAISQRLVRLMGGELAVDSTPGVGSSFHFTIPFEPCNEPTAPPRNEETLRGLRVLAVDDNASAREVMKGLLESFGWRVELAASGAEALGMLDSCKRAGQGFDVVLMDWRMPGIDGWDTSLHIRSLYPDGHMPLIVMVTAHGRELMAQRQAEFPLVLDGFLVKPVTASILYDTVADAHAGRNREALPQLPVPPRSQRLMGLRMLVAEDNATNQQVARELLQSEGATVTIADTGLAAIAAIETVTASQSAPFDVVLMDIQMPEMDGYAATRAIRSRLGFHDLPIIAMTANAMSADRSAAMEAGMNDHVAKPFDLAHLIDVILRCLGRSAAAGDLGDTKVPVTVAEVDPTWKDVLDVEAALVRLGGHTDIYVRMLNIFGTEVSAITEQIAALATAPQISDKALHAALHNLKGVAATVGAQPLADLAAQAEQASAADWANPQSSTDWVAVLTTAGMLAAMAAADLADSLSSTAAKL